MNSDTSLASPPSRDAVAMFCNVSRSARSACAIAWILAISGSLPAINGCDRSPPASQQAAVVSTDVPAKGNPLVAAPMAPATQPSTIQYASSADAGQALVSGTSTLHDWTVKSIFITGNAEFSGQWKQDIAASIALQSIDLSISVNSLKSTEGGGMDNTMYDALKFKQFPAISYSLTNASLKAAPSKQDPAYHFDTTGQLTVAGVAHEVTLDLAVVSKDHGLLTITTDVALKMTDFGMKPPTAMLGMIKSGDAITVKVIWQLAMRPAAAKAEK